MANIPLRVNELVETFDRNIKAYCSQQYNETQLRREFIDPFFEELGWDVTNKAGYAQAYKDVIHKKAIKVEGVIKALPDNIQIQYQIVTTGKQIDKLVYDLYGLTEEEIKIVESEEK